MMIQERGDRSITLNSAQVRRFSYQEFLLFLKGEGFPVEYNEQAGEYYEKDGYDYSTEQLKQGRSVRYSWRVK